MTNNSTQIEGENSMTLNSLSVNQNLIAKTTDDLIHDLSVVDGLSGSRTGANQAQIPRAGSMIDARMQQSLKKKQM